MTVSSAGTWSSRSCTPSWAADPSFGARFHEAVNAALTHPNIVALYDTGEQGAVAYIVMELVSRPTLREALGRHGPPAAVAGGPAGPGGGGRSRLRPPGRGLPRRPSSRATSCWPTTAP